MKRVFTISLCFFVFYSISFAQLDQYASEQNKFYWKNRKPTAGYWQQDVYYNIKAAIDEKTDIISGVEELTYRNNSPDTLKFIFMHLYQNAFVPGGYLNDLNKANQNKVRYGKYESQGLGIEITNINTLSVNGIIINKQTEKIIDNTIMKIMLPQPLMPGHDLVLKIDFKTYYDKTGQRRRLQMFENAGNKHYNGCQWYPKMCVYDSHRAWNTDQHLGREFYGEYGVYDVELTFANNFIVEATGVLVNEKEVLPDELRKKLDVKNFKERPASPQPSTIIIPDGSTKTWKFHAENVHDFAFTADPSYRLSDAYWNGVRCVAIAREQHCYGWQSAAEYTARIIEVFSRDFGMYDYPKIVTADANDGMEYPMITMDNGTDPGFRGLLCHEIGHNWFYGMVGSNETYRPLLDEGFAQLLKSWGMEMLEGYHIKQRETTWKDQKRTEPLTYQMTSAYGLYYNYVLNDKDGFINTHSDGFSSALGHGGGYGMVYYKTATMLYNLQYILGDSLFLKAMQHYVAQWKFCHPYPEDFRNSITEYVKTDLSWFFDQWMETNKKLDYKICKYRKADEKDAFNVYFKRKGRMQSSIDFSVYSNCGVKYDYHIPNNWFVKQTDATVLPKWEGWDNLRNTYKAQIKIPCGISSIVIDTTDRLGDAYRLDNRLPRPFKLVFDKWQKPAYSDWKSYVFYLRPDVWFNNYDGLKVGVHAESNYMNTMHFFSGDVWINTTVGQNSLSETADINKNDPASFRINYKTPLKFVAPGVNFWIGGGLLDGLTFAKSGGDLTFLNNRVRLFAEYKLMYRRNTNTLEYLLYPNEWQSALMNTSVTLGAEAQYRKNKWNGSVVIQNTSASLFSDYSYSKLSLTNITNYETGKIDWRLRVFGQYGYGQNVPMESALYLAGANPEELMESAWTRSRAFVPYSWLGYGDKTNHFQQGGGLNLRGYAGYLVPQNIDGEQRYFYRAISGASVSLEIDFDRLIPLRPSFTKKWLKADLYFFGDAGAIATNNSNKSIQFTNLKSDAGIGTAFTIKKFGRLNAIKPLTIRCDFPFLLSSAPYAEKDYVKLRYVIGIGRTF